MKVVIDLIEEIRESIADAQSYTISAGLLKQNEDDATKLHYVGEAMISSFSTDEDAHKLRLVVGSEKQLHVEEIVPSLLIADMDTMMYEVTVDVNENYRDMEVVGFGKNDEEKRFVLFIQV